MKARRPVACLELDCEAISRKMQADFSAEATNVSVSPSWGSPSLRVGTNPQSVSGRTGARGAREHGEVLENFVRRGETMRLNPGIQKYRESAKRRGRDTRREIKEARLRRPRAPERALSKSSLNPWKKPPPPKPPRKRKPRSSRRSPQSSPRKPRRRTSSSKPISRRSTPRASVSCSSMRRSSNTSRRKSRLVLPANIELDDLISSGVIGLMDAIEKYDSKPRQQIQDLRRIPHPRRHSRRASGAGLGSALRARKGQACSSACYAKIEQSKGRQATDEEVCEELNINRRRSTTTCSIRSEASRLLSYDDISTFSKADQALDCTAIGENGAKAPTPFNEVNVASVKRMIADAINDLPEKQRLVLSLVLLRGSESQGNRPSPGCDRVAA